MNKLASTVIRKVYNRIHRDIIDSDPLNMINNFPSNFDYSENHTSVALNHHIFAKCVSDDHLIMDDLIFNNDYELNL